MEKEEEERGHPKPEQLKDYKSEKDEECPACEVCKDCPKFDFSLCPKQECEIKECEKITCPECEKVECPVPRKCAVYDDELVAEKVDPYQHHRKFVCSPHPGMLDGNIEHIIRFALLETMTYNIVCQELGKKLYRDKLVELQKMKSEKDRISERVEKLRMEKLRELQKQLRDDSVSLSNCRKRYPANLISCGIICANNKDNFCSW